MLGVDEGADPAHLLGLGDDLVDERRLSGRLGTEDLHDAPARHAAHAERDVDRQRAGRDRGHSDAGRVVAEAHQRTLAELALDLRHGGVQRGAPGALGPGALAVPVVRLDACRPAVLCLTLALVRFHLQLSRLVRMWPRRRDQRKLGTTPDGFRAGRLERAACAGSAHAARESGSSATRRIAKRRFALRLWKPSAQTRLRPLESGMDCPITRQARRERRPIGRSLAMRLLWAVVLPTGPASPERQRRFAVKLTG